MTKILKKLTVFALVISLVLTYVPVSASRVDDEAIFQMEAFGIFAPDANGSVDWDKNITRAELAHAIAVITGNTSVVVNYDLYDVNATTPYQKDIYTMMFLGVMSGDGNGYFRPYDDVNGTEASIVFLRLLGYGPVISGNDYVSKTTEWSAKTGILKGVELSDGFQRRDFARMFYNALDVNLMDVYYMSDYDIKYHISDTTFRDVVYVNKEENGTFYGKGVIMQNAMAFVDVPYKTLKSDEIIIGNTVYKTGKTNAQEFLGMDVQFFAKKNADGIYELISLTPTHKNKVVHFGPSDFVDYEQNSHITYRDGTKNKEIKIDTRTSLIKNYDTVAVPSEDLLSIDCGEFTVIDNDNDSVADVIIVYSYENLVVNGVYDNVVSLKEGFELNGMRHINLSPDTKDFLFTVIDADGENYDINKLSGGSVISVATDRAKKILRIVVNEDAKFTAQLNSVSSEGFEFEDKVYEVVCDDAYELGTVYDFYVNFLGYIVYFEPAADDGNSKYGYIIGSDVDRKTGSRVRIVTAKTVDFGIEINDEDADNVSQVPMLICQNESIEIYELADKVRFNGTRIEEKEIDSKLELCDGIFEYKLNAEGEITEFTSPEFKAGSVHTTYSYSVYDKCFGGAGTMLEGFALNENTKILCLPTNEANDEDYLVKSVINVAGNTIGYYVRGYDFDTRTKKCRLVVLSREMRSDNVPGVTMDSSKVAIVEKASKVAVEDDEVRTCINFIIGNESKTMFVSRAAQDTVPNLKSGDLFVYEENYDGEIANLQKIRSAEDLSTDFNQVSSLASGASETFGLLKDIQYDEVDNIYTRIVMQFEIDVNGTEVIKKIPQRIKPPIYIYEGKGEVSSGSVEDIVLGTDKVYVFMKNANTTSVVLVVK